MTKQFKVSLIINVDDNGSGLDIEDLKDITKDDLYECIRNEFDTSYYDISIEEA